MAGKKEPNGGTTPLKREGVQGQKGDGGVRSSDDPVLNLWFGQPAGERRDATCSAGGRATKDVVTAPLGAISAQNRLGVANPIWRGGFGPRERNSESRMRENRPSGLMRGGEQTVIGLVASQSVAPCLLYTRGHLTPLIFMVHTLSVSASADSSLPALRNSARRLTQPHHLRFRRTQSCRFRELQQSKSRSKCPESTRGHLAFAASTQPK